MKSPSPIKRKRPQGNGLYCKLLCTDVLYRPDLRLYRNHLMNFVSNFELSEKSVICIKKEEEKGTKRRFMDQWGNPVSRPNTVSTWTYWGQRFVSGQVNRKEKRKKNPFVFAWTEGLVMCYGFNKHGSVSLVVLVRFMRCHNSIWTFF